MNYIIYKVTNKINNKIYIGKTCTTLEKRKSEHYREARYCEKWDIKDNKFHKALLKYKYEDFIWEIEDCTSKSEKELYNKEIFYIEKYDSFNNGYNSTIGGENPPKTFGEQNIQARLSDEEADEIKMLLKETVVTQKEIAKMYNVHVTTIERIQAGKIRHDENIDYPIRKYSKYEVIALAIIEDLKNTTLTNKEIGAKYGVGEDISCRINTGKRYNYLYNGDYPIRKK